MIRRQRMRELMGNYVVDAGDRGPNEVELQHQAAFRRETAPSLRHRANDELGADDTMPPKGLRHADQPRREKPMRFEAIPVLKKRSSVHEVVRPRCREHQTITNQTDIEVLALLYAQPELPTGKAVRKARGIPDLPVLETGGNHGG